MEIPKIQPLQMNRTNPLHAGAMPLSNIQNSPLNRIPNLAGDNQAQKRQTFSNYLTEALKSMNQNQLDVSALQEKVITDPDSVDIHDVTIATAKARMSLNLAQTVIDRIVQDWNEISTTR